MSDLSQISVGLLPALKSELDTNAELYSEEYPNLSHSYSVIQSVQLALLELLAEKKEEISDVKNDRYFYKMLAVFMGCVNPRSFYDTAQKQGAELKTVIARLIFPTEFEIEGWKRILPNRTIFEQVNIKLDEYVLSYKEVFHPTDEYLNHFTKLDPGKLPEVDTTDGFDTGTIIEVTHPNKDFKSITATVIEKDHFNYHLQIGSKMIKIPFNRITYEIYELLQKETRNQKHYSKMLRTKSLEIPKNDYMLHSKGFILKFQSKLDLTKTEKGENVFSKWFKRIVFFDNRTQVQSSWQHVTVTNGGIVNAPINIYQTNNWHILGLVVLLASIVFAYLLDTKSEIKNIITNYIVNNTISENAELNANVDIMQ